MPIRFRCDHCRTLMSISRKKAGEVVNCPRCQQETFVPLEDTVTPEAPETNTSRPAAEPAEAPAPPPLPSRKQSTNFPLESSPLKQGAGPEAFPPQIFPATIVPADSGNKDDISPAAIEDSPAEFSARSDLEEEDDEEETGFQLKGEIDSDDEMDLTPMVDVTFLLLIFFMITASFTLQKTIQVPTPDESKRGATQAMQSVDDMESTSIVVKIDPNNVVVVDDEPLARPDGLVDLFREKMARERKTEVVISAHSQSLHRVVISVIDAANAAGMQKIGLVTRSTGS